MKPLKNSLKMPQEERSFFHRGRFKNDALHGLLLSQNAEHLSSLARLQLIRKNSSFYFGIRLGTQNPPTLALSPLAMQGRGCLLDFAFLWFPDVPDLWV